MIFFKRKYTLKRFLDVKAIKGYMHTPYTLISLYMDVQTPSKVSTNKEDGSESVQSLKVFCDSEIFCDDSNSSQKADRLWFQGKWFYCKSSRLSDNTVLRHWTCTFTQCKEQAPPPTEVSK